MREALVIEHTINKWLKKDGKNPDNCMVWIPAASRHEADFAVEITHAGDCLAW